MITMNREVTNDLIAVLGHASGRADFPETIEALLVGLEHERDALDIDKQKPRLLPNFVGMGEGEDPDAYDRERDRQGTD
jgi:hypothetical protein